MKKKILLLEHDPDVREMLTCLFSDVYEVEAAGLWSAHLLNSYRPDLLLLDGFILRRDEYLCRLLLEGALSSFKVLLVSTDRFCQFRHSASGFLEKPFDIQLLDMVVAAMIGGYPDHPSICTFKSQGPQSFSKTSD